MELWKYQSDTIMKEKFDIKDGYLKEWRKHVTCQEWLLEDIQQWLREEHERRMENTRIYWKMHEEVGFKSSVLNLINHEGFQKLTVSQIADPAFGLNKVRSITSKRDFQIDQKK